MAVWAGVNVYVVAVCCREFVSVTRATMRSHIRRAWVVVDNNVSVCVAVAYIGSMIANMQ